MITGYKKITPAELEAKKALKDLQEKAKIIQGFLDGKQVQVYDGEEWIDVVDIDFDGCYWLDYRLKPDLVEGWVNVYEDGDIGMLHSTKEQAQITKTSVLERCLTPVRIAHIREVEE